MSREHRLFLEDMRKACEKIAAYAQRLTREEFLADAKTFDAVMRNLEVIGEAAKHIPPDVRTQHPSINWRKISGLRDVAIHEYFGVDVEIIWDIVTREVPTLLIQLKRILSESH